MIVGDLLELDDLHIEVAWADPHALGREVTGVTTTDLQDPTRYLQRGELVLSGLVWWRPEDGQAAMRFANSLRAAEVAALLAGEGSHGTVPPELVEACRRHGIPLLSISSGTSFRAVTDRIYLRLWGGLQARAEGKAALPAAVSRTLTQMIRAQTPLDDVLVRAVTDLGLPECSLITGAGRLLAGSASGTRRVAPVPVGPAGDSPFDGWLLQPHTECGPTADTLLHGLAELLAPVAIRARATASARRETSAQLIQLIDSGAETEGERALSLSGLPARRRLTPVAARIDGTCELWTAAALAEALHESSEPFIAAPDGRSGAVALSAADEEALASTLQDALARLESRLPDRRRIHIGVGTAVEPAAAELRSALTQARYATRLQPPGTIGRCSQIDSLVTLLRGVPVEVTSAFRERVLAPLLEHDGNNGVSLVHTLDTFLHHSASWSRTAQALHVHVNTVHYRISRIEELTGRSLRSLTDRLDLWAALRCPAPSAGSTRHVPGPRG